MDLHQLKVFREVARSSGFTRASDRLHLSQSTVSLHIKRLEEELGTTVFSRSRRRVQLSPAGERLLPFVDRIFEEMKNAETAVRELQNVERGTIRIGTGATTVTYLLPKVLKAFQRRFPEVELIVTTGSTETLLQAIQQQSLDLAIIMPYSKTLPEVELIPLLNEELVYVIASDHPLAQNRSITPHAISETPFIAYFHDSVMQRMLDRQLGLLGITPHVTMEMENIEAIKALVRAGLGGAILPICSVAGAFGSGLLPVRIGKHRMERSLALALPANRSTPLIQQRLTSTLIKAFGQTQKPSAK